MPERIAFVQPDTGHDADRGPCWISPVAYWKTWRTACWRGRTLRRWKGLSDARFSDVDTREQFGFSGPHRDRRDTRYSSIAPEVDEDVQECHERFSAGEPLPGRERR
jgi:hypothetical protein